MRVKTVINWGPIVFSLALLMLVGGGFFISLPNDIKSGDQLQHHYKINNHLWLYITENREGDATLPIVNRFYLTGEILGDEKSVIKLLNHEIPFLTGSGTINNITVTGDYNVCITYSGKIYSLSNSIDYLLNGQLISAHLSYVIN
ncbi:hypothetical protein [Rosenbergiella australiborealis]|uniref:hypothetical protein n=1 Tax=Rosenbergiella australiborealis TaxID=1544696 RepID=UPI001F4E002F|nr:hypothetical protein [Rosenbergiella australiborealis]